MKKIIGICLLVLLAVAGFAQASAQSSESNAPVLEGNIRGKKAPLELQKLDIDVKIAGFISETRMTMTFYNPHDRELVGDLTFPLPEGAFVSGYALDINGRMIDGVVVEKKKGRMVFDEIVRRGIDPGLVEWVQGNNFKTSVYPIFPKRSRTVMVRFVSELLNEKGNHVYFLPLKYNIKVKEFSLHVALTGQDDEDKDSGKNKKNSGLDLTPWKKQRVTRTEKKNFLLDEDIRVPLPGEKRKTIAIEANDDGEYYFSFHDFSAMPKAAANTRPIRPKRITVLWDTSKSRGGAETQRKQEMKILERYLLGLADKRVTVDLYAFNIKKIKIGRFTVHNGDARPLLQAIKSLAYDGGTAMSAITPGKKEKQPDLYLLFSDGKHNFGIEKPGDIDAPLFAVSASSSANHALLEHAATGSGGRYFNLNRMALADVLGSIGRLSYTLISVNAAPSALGDTWPKTGHQVTPGFVFTGKLLKKTTRVTLNYGIGGRVLKRMRFALSRKHAAGGNTVRTFWARKKIEGLSVFAKTHWKELIEIGKRYGLVTPGTSLIVLERLDDYLRYRIRPPEALPEMREEYDKEIGDSGFFNVDEAMKKALEEDLEDIVEEWEDVVEWWNKKFEPPKKKPVKKGAAAGTAGAARPAQISQNRRTRADRGTVDFNAERDIVRSESVADARMGNGGMRGEVVLEDGSKIPGVLVTLTSTSLHNRMSTVTNEDGRYRIMGLAAGKYDIRFHLEGFKTINWKDIPLASGRSITLRPVIMQTANISEEIVVCGASPVVDVGGGDPGVSIKAWDPDTPYMKKLKQAKKGSLYRAYLKQRKEHGGAPGFYLDCANYFFTLGNKEKGLLILSNLAELEIEDSSMLRVLAYRLSQLDHLEESERIFEVVAADRFEEPQSYRDLALVREQLGKYKSAAELLYKVALIEWDDRFDGINMTALVELNHVLARARRKGLKITKWGIDPRLIKLLDVDIRIIMTWDNDRGDMDLWVVEPGGEKCYYGNDETKTGGRLSDDFTGGLGPEEYMIHRAMPGKYIIKANYYGSGRGAMAAPVTVQVDVFTNYGRKNEKRQSLTLRLANRRDVYQVGEIKQHAAAPHKKHAAAPSKK